jgi:hypothetical protein
MAKSKKTVVAPELTKEQESSKKLLMEARRNYKLDMEADKKNRDGYLEDMRFTLKPGEQWLAADKTDRGSDRPMYEFNELRIKCKNAINQIRTNRPQAKIRGFEDNDKELAEIRQGLFLNIWNDSDGDSVTDYAALHQVVGGMGAARVDTEYADDSVSEQNIKIRSVINPMTLLADRNSREELKRDAKHWFVLSRMPNEDFDATYPDKDRVSFEIEDDLEEELNDEDTTWVAEYWKKVPVTRHLCLLSNGKTIDKNDPNNGPMHEGVKVIKDRKVKSHKIVQYIISGDSILEGPNDWAGKEFPFVPVYGEYMVVDGKVTWYGLPRFGKDAQRAHNWAMTSVIEAIAAAPQAKWWATAKQAEGHTTAWAEANKKNFPFMLYNVDPESPGPPGQMGGADVPIALIQASQMSATALNNTVGVYEANEGRQSNETSGRAIRARQESGQLATYNFGDNIAKFHRRIAEIVLDLQPKIYDTERNLRILGKDGSEKYIRINQPDPVTGQVQNDMSQGHFDIVVTTGPSYATQRQEAAEFYTQFSASNPALAAVAGDLIVKAQDYPYSDAIAERLRMALPPQILQQLASEGQQSPEVAAAMAQVQAMEQQITQQGQLVQQAAQEAQEEQNAAGKAKADVAVASANIKVQEAQLAQKVAEFKELVATENAKLGATTEQQAATNDRESLGAEVQKALATLQQQAADFQQQALQTIMQAQAVSQPQVVVMNPPKQKTIVLQRQNGQTVGQVTEVPTADDQQVVSQAAEGAAQQLQNFAQQLATNLNAKPKTSKKAATVRTADGFETVIQEVDEAGNVVGAKKATSKRGANGLETSIETVQ